MKYKLCLFLLSIFVVAPLSTAWAFPEICGNGRDEDGNGSDLPCPEPDKDNDGYKSVSSGGNDCDDNNFMLYPGVITELGCPTGQTRQCNTNGNFSACSAATVCEAPAGSSCKYIDCNSGNDTSGNGTFSKPWKSFKMVGAFDNGTDRPAGWYQVKPGDVVYLMGSGVCSEWYVSGAGRANVVVKITASGTKEKPIVFKRYPGSKVKIDPPFSSYDFQGIIFRVDTSSFVKIEDFELTGSYSATIYLTDTKNIDISRVRCYDTQGSTYDNVACINSAAGPAEHYIHHNEFFDVYEPQVPESDNVSLIAYFGGRDNRFEYNRLFYSKVPGTPGAKIGRCFKYKHPATAGVTTLVGNQLYNCRKPFIENGSISARVFNNLLVNDPSYTDAAGYSCGDFGSGTAYCKDAIVKNNTFVNMSAFFMRQGVNANLGTTTFQNNIVTDSRDRYSSENGFYRIERYGSDAEYNQFRQTNALNADYNCFYNPKTSLVFDFFGDNSTGTLGSMLSFSDWKGLGYDKNTLVEDPKLDQYFRATSTNCKNYGWNQVTQSIPGGTIPQPPKSITVKQIK